MIRVVVAEDQHIIREAFTRLINAQPQMRVIAAVGDGAQAVTYASEADVIVMDIRMPVMDGIEATRRIVQNSPSPTSPRVLVLTTFREEDLVLEALSVGASGFILKDSEPQELLRAICLVYQGEGVLDSKITPMVLRHVTTPHSRDYHAGRAQRPEAYPAMSLPVSFTPREEEILGLVCEGLSNDEIADKLIIATTTVKSHVKSLLMKTHARNRVELVIWAAQHGRF